VDLDLTFNEDAVDIQIMKKIIASTYCYFLLKKISMPYFRTIIIYTGLLMVHFILIYIIFPIPNSLNPFGLYKKEIKNWIPTGIILIISFMGFSLIFKKKDLGQYSFTENETRIYLRKVLIYFLILFCAMIILSTLHIREKW
jgi:hypothetical protein